MIDRPPINPGRSVDWQAVKVAWAKKFGPRRVRRYNKCPSTCPRRITSAPSAQIPGRSGQGHLSDISEEGSERVKVAEEGNFDMLYLRVLNTFPCYHQERP